MYNSGMQNKPSPEHIISWRQERRRKKRASALNRLKRFGIGILAVFSLVLVAAILLGTYTYATITKDLPSIELFPELLGPRGQLRHPTRIYDRTGETLLATLENPNASGAEYLFLELIPQDAIDAILVMRDPTFWEHGGFVVNADQPTLAEQLVLETLIWQDAGGWQKTWRVRLLAAQITQTYGRETVLEWYLNNAYFGQLAYGIDEAARVYFGKPAAALSLAEAATLGAVINAPALNPIEAEQVAIERQGKTLNAMLNAGYITSEQAMRANSQAILIQSSALPLQMLHPSFTNLALEDLYQQIGKERIQRGGLEVITSVDLALQEQVACSIEVQLARLEGRLPLNSLGGITCPGAALLPTIGRDFSPAGTALQAGAVVLEPATGELLAVFGPAAAPQEAGTILSPYIYLTAFTRGMGPASLVWDIPASIPPGLEEYHNLDTNFHGPMRVRTASAHDYLVPILASLRQIGPNNAWRTIQQSGIYSIEIPTEDSYAPLLENSTTSLLEITHAYSMLANQGLLAGTTQLEEGIIRPVTILQIKDAGQRIWQEFEPEKQSVTTPQLAYLVTDMLADEEARRMSLGHPNAYEIGRPAAAKWGRAVSNHGIWSVGYTPDRVTGIWLGYADQADGSPVENIPPQAADGLWHAIMKTAHTELPIKDFKEPIGVVRKVVCNPSGLLPTNVCPETVSEIFIVGNEPVQTDNLYQTFQINTQTNRLATIYTPSEFLEERVFLVVPPEAVTWAQQQGLETPPDTYDVVFNPAANNPNAGILQPEIFSYVSGEVDITGNAGGATFEFYRVQVGSGLNPQQWIQLGEAATSPVSGGTLATWDTTGLDGLYAIQLQVVQSDQSIETASIQVTIDNKAPVIQVLHPTEGETFSYPGERAITFQAQVSDNLNVARVEFWLDGNLISSLTSAPFAAPWTGSRGEHELEVRAIDLAGNIAIELVPFSLD